MPVSCYAATWFHGDPCTADTCDTDYDECLHGAVDADADGYPAAEVDGTTCTGGTDCLDDLATAFPGAPVVECSELDNDCNANADEDNDGDGHVALGCGGDDCHDDDALVFLGECSGVNECCDGCFQVNGCWIDPTTGYMWQDVPMDGHTTWDLAAAYCALLSLAGHGMGEWHLPTISELRTLVRGCPATAPGGACGLTDACLDEVCNSADCNGCAYLGGPRADGYYLDPVLQAEFGMYWSSSSCTSNPTYAWRLCSFDAGVSWFSKDDTSMVRCVRPGS